MTIAMDRRLITFRVGWIDWYSKVGALWVGYSGFVKLGRTNIPKIPNNSKYLIKLLFRDIYLWVINVPSCGWSSSINPTVSVRSQNVEPLDVHLFADHAGSDVSVWTQTSSFTAPAFPKRLRVIKTTRMGNRDLIDLLPSDGDTMPQLIINITVISRINLQIRPKPSKNTLVTGFTPMGIKFWLIFCNVRTQPQRLSVRFPSLLSQITSPMSVSFLDERYPIYAPYDFSYEFFDNQNRVVRKDSLKVGEY